MAQSFAARSAAVSIALLTGGILAAGPAQAAPPPPVQPFGTVLSPSGVNERAYPSTDSSVRGTLARGTKVGLRCKVHAQTIGKSSVWYLMRSRGTWVSSQYITNSGQVPLCKDLHRSVLDDGPLARAAMG
ncbi:SH3 domain-containing protein [Streptomyces stramineus]|uniref:SH3b domain-containing protein n=1 Tax=Streptomyces stramineus TaxID=173861 RepID=A0ABP3KFA4_9ACTN